MISRATFSCIVFPQIDINNEIEDLEMLRKSQMAAIATAQSRLDMALECENLEGVNIAARVVEKLEASMDETITQLLHLKYQLRMPS